MIFHQKLNGATTHSIADLHFNHKNIVRGESNWEGKKGTRDFANRSEMNRAIIKSINEQVPTNHDLIIIGDFLFGDKSAISFFRHQINCRNVHLIYGNHDKWLREKTEYHNLFSSIHDYLELLISDRSGKFRLACFFHYPLKSWNEVRHGSIAITGHEHGSLPYEDHEPGIDIGWENFKRPLSFHEICDLMDKKVRKPIGHH